MTSNKDIIKLGMIFLIVISILAFGWYLIDNLFVEDEIQYYPTVLMAIPTKDYQPEIEEQESGIEEIETSIEEVDNDIDSMIQALEELEQELEE